MKSFLVVPEGSGISSQHDDYNAARSAAWEAAIKTHRRYHIYELRGTYKPTGVVYEETNSRTTFDVG